MERVLCMFVPGKGSEGTCHSKDLLRAHCQLVGVFTGCFGGVVTEPSRCATQGEQRQASVPLPFLYRDLHPLGWCSPPPRQNQGQIPSAPQSCSRCSKLKGEHLPIPTPFQTIPFYRPSLFRLRPPPRPPYTILFPST